jgi:hypothetical protein
MIVYRDQRSRVDPHCLLSRLQSVIQRCAALGPSHDVAREVLIETGRLESAVLDAVFPQTDGVNPLSRSLRQAALAAGHLLWHSWHGNAPEMKASLGQLSHQLEAVKLLPLPSAVEVTVPEGYAYYSVYPEMYLEAAKRSVDAMGQFPAVCLGLRSIGTSLSAAVAAALEELGCTVESVTLRPRGHPFSRHPRLDRHFVSFLRSRAEPRFVLVDEGPGISGSSLASTASMLHAWGIDDDRIFLFPSWETDGSTLQSLLAREQWPRHRQFVVSFEEVWLRSGRLTGDFPGHMRDISAGGWREEVYPSADEYPAVQQQHERRKYLLTDHASRQGQQLLRFVGLGEYAAPKVRRAERLADAGFTPRPEKVAHGFVLQPFLPGRPVSAGQTDAQLIDVVASYLAHLCREHAAEPSVSDSSLREMIAVNVAEGLRDSYCEKLGTRLPSQHWAERPVALDGRMLAHEWICTVSGYQKVDAMDHHDDHFFPGSQDIAWDLAAAALEFELSDQSRQYLLARYRSLSGDHTVGKRLPHYAISYLAFRLGYTTLAAGVLANTPDGLRFENDARRYARLLRHELSGTSAGGWNV